jgi:hypothetical protein
MICYTSNAQGSPLSRKRIQRIGPGVDRIKRTLLEIGHTRRMKSRTEYVRRECVAELRRQIATHQRFKRLADQGTGLSIEHSRLTMRIAQPTAAR